MEQVPSDPTQHPERLMSKWKKETEAMKVRPKVKQSLKQKLINIILNIFGLIYIKIEQYKSYPNDHDILGVSVDMDLYDMSRKQLCRYMDAVLPEKGFFELQSTTKIRLGCQLLRNFHLAKKELKVVQEQAGTIITEKDMTQIEKNGSKNTVPAAVHEAV
jgi:hypothetical protein